MKQLAILALAALLTIGILACGTESAEPEATAAPASGGAQATEPPADPTNTPLSDPTSAPANTPVPADTPEPTDTPVPEPTNTPVPEPEAPSATTPPEPTATMEPEATAVPDPTATMEPEATAVPDPTATMEPEATAVPDPTATSEPAPTETPALPIAADLTSLGDNLLFVTYFDNATQEWLVYDSSGTFSPDQLPIPPEVSVPDESEIGALTELVSRNIYNIKVLEDQTVTVNGKQFTFYAGTNPIAWP